MVRNYVRRTNHNAYDIATIISALKSLRETSKTLVEVAKDHNMKTSALGYHWRRHNKENTLIAENVLRKRNTLRVFTDELERELLSCIIMCAEVYTTVGSVWIRQLAYELAIENKVVVPQNWKKRKIAGRDWYFKFKERHSSALAENIPESTSYEQIMGTHKHKGDFFNRNYSALLLKYKFQPRDVFILEQCKIQQKPDVQPVVDLSDDERSSKKQDVAQKNVPTKGKSLVTFVGTVSAIGQSIPPYYIFSYTRFHKNPLLQEAPKGSKAKSNPTGTMTSKIFLDYLKHVADYVDSSVEKPVLLLIDDHRYHISLRAAKFAKQNGIVILTFPPRTKNKVQLLERSMCSSMKTEFEDIKLEEESMHFEEDD